ncbi:MAG: hypothetical protein Fur0046_37300 [Cyanobacteria bacterium J069]|nr:MAG: hypothetical protein D6742_19210 [Cyanobacteria bacterium J069]
MPKSRKLEALIAALEQIRSEPASEAGLSTLRQALNSRYAVAIAHAAKIIGRAELPDLTPELIAAYDRCMTKPADTDPGCRAKQAIADALYRLSHSDEALFLSGIRHVQLEPVWGGQVDTAPALRGTCALGLVRMNYAQAMMELADLLADPEPEARIGAARAIAYSDHDQGVPLLRLRIKIGDTSAVLMECLMALLKLAPASSLPLLKDLLYARPKDGSTNATERAEVAALALGESRLVDAFPLLRDWWAQVKDAELRRSGLVAIATLRQSAAIDWLMALIADGMTEDAKSAIKALSLYQTDALLWGRVHEMVQERQSEVLLNIFRELSR